MADAELKVLKLEEDQRDSDDSIIAPGDEKEKVEETVRKETEMFVKQSAKSGLGGLSLEECVVGSMFSQKFQFMPDPLSEVNSLLLDLSFKIQELRLLRLLHR